MNSNDELVRLDDEFDCEILKSRGLRMLGRCGLAQGDHSSASEHLEKALAGFLELQESQVGAGTTPPGCPFNSLINPTRIPTPCDPAPNPG
jgi:hypothetical protein